MLLPCVVITLSVPLSIAFLLRLLCSSGRIKVRLERSLELIVFFLTPERGTVFVIENKDSEGQAHHQLAGDCDRSDALVLAQKDVTMILWCAGKDLQEVCELIRRFT